MFVECDQAAVNAKDWLLAQGGNADARARIRASLTGISCYAHNLSANPDDEVPVSFRDLYFANCIDGLTVEVRP